MANQKKPQPSISPANYIKQAARKVPIHEVLSDYGTHDDTLVQFFVLRKKVSGNYILGGYIVDTGCLGLKSTHFRHSFTQDDLDDYLENMIDRSMRNIRAIDPNLAFNVIYGAIEYAEDLGFKPMDKDWAITQFILPTIDDIEYVEVEFGKDGKPFYLNGPFDNVNKVLATLTKSVGAGNFEFIAQIG